MKSLRSAFMTTVLIGFLYYMWIHPNLFTAIRGISYITIGILAVLGSLMFLLNVLILRIFLHTFNVSVTLRECFGISTISAMGNYLAPFGGGTAGKAVYLKRRYDFPYPTFLASMSAASILDLLWAGFIGSSVLVISWKISFLWGQALLAVFLTLMIVSLMALSLNPQAYDGRFLKPMRNVLDGWGRIRRDRDLIIKVSLLLLANYLLSSAELFAGYSAFSIKLGIADAILLSAISSMSSIVRVTPANIGIHEVIIASSSHLLGLGLGQGLLAAGLSRVISIGLIFSFGGLYMMSFGYRKGQEDEGIFSGSR